MDRRLYSCNVQHVMDRKLYSCNVPHVMDHRLYSCNVPHVMDHRLYSCNVPHVMDHRLYSCNVPHVWNASCALKCIWYVLKWFECSSIRLLYGCNVPLKSFTDTYSLSLLMVWILNRKLVLLQCTTSCMVAMIQHALHLKIDIYCMVTM
jgi:hypothetical protein